MKAALIGAGQIARQYLPCLNALPGIRAGRHLHGYLAAQGQKLGRHRLIIGPLTRMPLTHLENRAGVFVLAGVGPSRGSSRSDSRTAGCGRRWAGPHRSTTCSA